MLRIYTLFLLCLLVGTTIAAQNRLIGPSAASFPVSEELPGSVRNDLPDGRFVQDTLLPAVFGDTCSSNVFNFGISGDIWGFVSGTNGYEDWEKTQRLSYTANTPFMVIETWAYFATASEVGNGNLRMKVYELAGGGAPGSLLATSSDIQVSDILIDAAVAVPTIFTYPDPPTLTETDFFAGIDVQDLYATNDTVSVFMTDDGCGDGNNVWEEWSDNTWHSYADPNNWDLNSELFIAAVIEFAPTSVADPFVETGNLKLYPAQPNPATNRVQIGFALATASQVKLEIFSAEGRLLKKQNLGHLSAGEYQEHLSVADLPAGNYVFAIHTDTDRLMSRIVVVK